MLLPEWDWTACSLLPSDEHRNDKGRRNNCRDRLRSGCSLYVYRPKRDPKRKGAFPRLELFQARPMVLESDQA